MCKGVGDGDGDRTGDSLFVCDVSLTYSQLFILKDWG